LTPIFWAAIALDAVLFVALIVLGMAQSGISDGGREMGMIFGVAIPAIVVGGGALLFLKTESMASRAIGLFIVAGPGLFIAAARLRSAAIDYQVRQNSQGSGYFSGRAMKRAGWAVVHSDTAALAALGPNLEVNTKGRHGMTLMQLAITQVVDSTTSINLVRALVARGADANAGLEMAIKREDGSILTALLDAGAKPNYDDDRGPVVFEWLGVTPIANFTALLDHGLDANLLDRSGTPLIVAAGRADRWDFVQLLMAHGADPLRKDREGDTLADVVKSRMESTMDRPAEMKAEIARVKAQLAKLEPVPR